ncbi:MSHA biogenesis protein MshJ [Oxalobacteraceae bacterium OM1]|nr:MSHA biogenesis protein MshJ [Oxalobacteraceae bacterium OM1]
MKLYWQKLAARIDALSSRERLMAFCIAALVLVALVNTFAVDPLMAQHEQLAKQAKQDEEQIAAVQAEIEARVAAHRNDPDASAKTRLQELKLQSVRLHGELLATQKGLISPDKMTQVLEDLLRRNAGLELVSLKKLPADLVTDPSSADNAPLPAQDVKAVKIAAPERESGAIYRHGVEIVIQGSYGDITRCLTELETMPWQLFWESAKLTVTEYPKARLTMNLFTLSLEKTWLNL